MSDGALGMVPLAGGFSGETFVTDAIGEPTVVRIYGERSRSRRGPEAGTIDAAVLRLVRGLIPVPEVLEVKRPDAAGEAPGLLVTSFLPGTRLDLLLPQLGDRALGDVGRRLGALLARLACMPMPRRGLFVDGDLAVEPLPSSDLADFVAARRSATALADWPADEYDALLEVADTAQTLLDRIGRTCLVHSDVNPKNVLVDPASLDVTGLLDWEFAHAGVPGTDLGNLLRFDRHPPLSDAVVAAYRERVPDAGDDVLDTARAADLFALIDLAARRGENPVTEQAHHLLRAVARSGDLHAVPAD
jgi:aminoglycoside phosphotransferase (APT) family kinase protein